MQKTKRRMAFCVHFQSDNFVVAKSLGKVAISPKVGITQKSAVEFV